MKFTIFVVLVGADSCNGGLTYSHYTEDVETQDECVSLAAEYAEIPFVYSTKCTIDTGALK
jgi:hypothetical protein